MVGGLVQAPADRGLAGVLGGRPKDSRLARGVYLAGRREGACYCDRRSRRQRWLASCMMR